MCQKCLKPKIYFIFRINVRLWFIIYYICIDVFGDDISYLVHYLLISSKVLVIYWFSVFVEGLINNEKLLLIILIKK